jgi:flagellar biosynthesis protein FlhF
MQAKRFQAQTLAEAYALVRDKLGDEAVILSTRNTIGPGRFGLGRREYVEVVAGLPEDSDAFAGTAPLAEDLAAHDFVRHVAEATARDGTIATDATLVAESAGAGALPTESPPPPDEPELAPPFINPMAGAAGGVRLPIESERIRAEPQMTSERTLVPSDGELLAGIASEVGELRTLVERLALDRADERIEAGPPTLRELRDRLGAQEVGAALAASVLDRVASALAPDASPEAAQQVVQRRLVAELPAPPRLDFARPPTTLFIVGPAGAGKTTAAVRLGLRLTTDHGLRVTLAGIDVDRVGAPQELQAYGAATGLGVRLCYTPGELQALVGERTNDVIIVDTPGHDGTRREHMAELQAFARAVRPRTLLLTLPATMRTADARRVTAAYRALAPDGLIASRCDETETFGGLLTIAVEASLGVAFTAHGPSVRDAAREGDNHALARAVMLGRWNANPAMTAASAS